MYLNHYNLNIKPFGISPDTRFLWLSEKHSEALATLQYGILDNKGFLLVTGDVGTGKTALINQLIAELEIDVIVASIPDPGLDLLDFFKILAVEFNMGTEFSSKGEFLIHFKNFLLKAYTKKSQVLLIIDEAQRLSHELLEQIRLLSNIELHNRKLINIFFVGQNEFNDMLQEERNRAVRQRITLKYNIDPLTENETDKYIKHRLKVAGATYDIFTPDAVQAIFSITNGYPRLINIICDLALLSGYALGITSIDRKIIKDCEKDLNVSIPFGGNIADNEKQEDAFFIGSGDLVPFIEAEKPAGGKKIGLIFSLIMAMIAITFGAYFLYRFMTGDDYAWSVNEIAPEKYTGLVPEKPRAFANAEKDANKNKLSQPAANGQLTEKTNRHRIQQPSQQSIDEGLLKDEKAEGKIAKGFSSDNNTRDNLDQITQPQTNTPTSLIEKTESDHVSRQQADTKTPDHNVQEEAITNQQNMSNSENTEIDDQRTGILASQSEPDKLIIYFNHNSNDLPIQEFDKLNYLIDSISDTPESKIIIEGFTDSLGNYYYNMQLSKFRADVVKNYLLSKGIVSEKIEVFGRGPENPIASNDTPEGRRRNRRVEVRIE